MTFTAAAGITALRSVHDELVALARDLADDQLLAPTGATEWSVAQVLSHLGSGTEISLATLHRAPEGADGPPEGFNNGVWDRRNVMTPREQADGFVVGDTALVDAIEALTAGQRDSLLLDLGFLPAPVPVASSASSSVSRPERVRSRSQKWSTSSGSTTTCPSARR